MRIAYLVVAAIAAAPLPSLSQRPEEVDLRNVLQASVVVDVLEGRFFSVSIDSVPAATPGADLINGHRRIFEYLVVHQVPSRQLFRDVHLATEPKVALIDNLLAESAATTGLTAYLENYGAGPAPAVGIERQTVSESEVLTVAARFFHPVLTGERSAGFYRCAGINGIPDLGSARNPIVEAFVFWALAPAIFDADSASVAGRALDADFQEAKASFLSVVEEADYSPATFASAREELYRTMSGSQAIRLILHRAYTNESLHLPFHVLEWGDNSI